MRNHHRGLFPPCFVLEQTAEVPLVLATLLMLLGDRLRSFPPTQIEADFPSQLFYCARSQLVCTLPVARSVSGLSSPSIHPSMRGFLSSSLANSTLGRQC